jgi:hypothetical protein
MSFGSLGGSLVHRAANRLQSGPVHTIDLARCVLGLSGHPAAHTVREPSPALLVSPPNDPAPLGLR